MIDRKVLMAAVESAIDAQVCVDPLPLDSAYVTAAKARRKQAVEVILTYFEGFRVDAEAYFKERMH